MIDFLVNHNHLYVDRIEPFISDNISNIIMANANNICSMDSNIYLTICILPDL